MASFLESFPILSFFLYLYTIHFFFFCDLVGNHMRDTSSNDLFQLSGRTERILDAGEGSVPVAAQRKEPSFEGKSVQVNESRGNGSATKYDKLLCM